MIPHRVSKSLAGSAMAKNGCACVLKKMKSTCTPANDRPSRWKRTTGSLASLVEDGDRLFAHAETATDTATKLGAKFAPTKKQKAVNRAWLAWQKEPGLPYGTAIRAKYFRHDAPAATAFVAWFRQLYEGE